MLIREFMKKTIAVLPGDGVGPEVINQGIKVLESVADKYRHQFKYNYALLGAAAIHQTGSPLPLETLETCLNCDAVFLGAIGDPHYDLSATAKIRPVQGLLDLRRQLGLYCSIRPIKIYPALREHSPLKLQVVNGVDLVIYRELTSGIYFGNKGRSHQGLVAYDHCQYSVDEIRRITLKAFEASQKRRRKLTLVDKANILETSRLWREVVQLLAMDFPDVEVDYMLVDNAAMQLILHPAHFDVILTDNMFGDILSDEASVLAGSIGLSPSASLGTKTAVFEPIHGSFPQGAGKDVANPIASILSAAMMLDYWLMTEEADSIRKAVNLVIEKGFGTEDLHPVYKLSCSHLGDLISSIIEVGLLDDYSIVRMMERYSTII